LRISSPIKTGLCEILATEVFDRLDRTDISRPDGEAALEGKPGTAAAWEKLISQYQILGKQAHVAHVVAVMEIHAVTEILTFNAAHFGVFLELGPSIPRRYSSPRLKSVLGLQWASNPHQDRDDRETLQGYLWLLPPMRREFLN
jgi:hypothetical protein